MAAQSAVNQLPPDPHPELKRFRAQLGKSNLLEVLDSLPTASGFQYFDTSFREKPAVKILLGRRRQDNGGFATSWAFIGLETSDTAVYFRDEEHHPPGSSTFYKRSASALVRKAQDLLPPFCFMQRDTYDEVKNIRPMLSALVLYYALMRGISEAALKWKRFHNSLMQALQYIDTQAAYHIWLGNAIAEAASSEATTALPSAESPSEAGPLKSGSSNEFQGGSVSSRGSSISPPAGTCLAKFMKLLGKDLLLLDNIPTTPVTIERQTLDTDQFPFRLLFGKCDGIDVHVYPNLPGGRLTKIMSQSQQQQQVRTWSYSNLDGVELLAPFARLMKLLSDSASRSNKMRYLVAYYFWLAEAEGLIDPPTFGFTPETMRPHFVALCRTFQRAGKDPEKSDNKPTLTVRLRPAREVLSILNEDTEDDGQAHPSSARAIDLRQPHDDMREPSEQSHSDALRNPAPDMPAPQYPELPDHMSNVNDKPNKVTPPHPETRKTPQSVRALSGDSGLNSKYTTPASTVDGTDMLLQDPVVEKPVDDETENIPGTPIEVVPTNGPISDAMRLDNDDGTVPSIEEPEELRTPLHEDQSNVGERQDAWTRPDETPDEALLQDTQDAMEVDVAPELSIEEPKPPQSPAQETVPAEIEQPTGQDCPTEVPDESSVNATAPEALELRSPATPRIDGPHGVSPPPGMVLGVIESTPERQLEAPRQRSVFSISSDDEIASRGQRHPAPQLNLQDESPWRKTGSTSSNNVVDFTKDDDDGMDLASRRRQRKKAEQVRSSQPRTLPSSRSRWRQTIIISDDEDDSIDHRTESRPQPPRVPSSRVRSRHTINITDDDDDENEGAKDDDDIMEDVDGDAWRRASLRQRPES